MGRIVRDGGVFVAYAAVSVVYFGTRHPGSIVVGHGPDPGIFIWSFAWWPHAIASWTNPLFTHAIYAPEGIDLAWTTSVPGLALPFTPVTVAFGPVAAYNVCAILLPAAAAWTAYLLCRHLTKSIWASLVGGYLFGFSSFVLGQQLQGHVHMTGIFLVPLFALSIVRYLEGEIDERGVSWRLALLAAWQLLISTELMAMITFTIVAGVALGYVFEPRLRLRIRRLFAPVAVAYGAAAVIDAPFVFYLLRGFHAATFADNASAFTDLANTVVPTETNGLAGGSFTSISRSFEPTESGLYLGLPVLIVLVLYGWRRRRCFDGRFLMTAFAVAVVLALGAALEVDGRRIVAMPWALAEHLPVLDNIRADRFALFVELVAAVTVASWIARTRGQVFARPYVLPVLVVAALVPNVALADYHLTLRQSPFFTSGAYRSCIQKGDTIAVYPIGQPNPVTQTDAMRWQALSGFRFRLAAGYLYLYGEHDLPLTAFDRDPIVTYLHYQRERARPTTDTLLAFMANHHVSRVVTAEPADYPTATQMQQFGSVETANDLLIAPACNHASLTSRNLTPYVNRFVSRQGTKIGFCLGRNYTELPYGLYPTGDLAGATHALMVKGHGLRCTAPAGYHQHGFAEPTADVPAHTYPYYAP